MRIETKTDNRRKMVQDIAEFREEELHYVGPPTFSYTVGRLTIDRDGVITSETEEGEDLLTQFLQEKGYLEAPVDDVRIGIPADTGERKFLQNLFAMIHARAYLLNRITRYETFVVSDSLLEKLEQFSEENAWENLQTLLSADTAALKGLSVEEGKVTFTFPLSPDSAKNKAYSELAAKIVTKAKEAKRVSATPVVEENEKYYLRIWLVQLGMAGAANKESRKALLDGLKGHTAFRTKEEAEKFSIAQKEKRAAVKAAQMAGQESEAV
ncbi:phage terminase small subunit P27 family [Drancourtella sp. An57]|uniref:phage terminase small subunit P27 family n=1 Tax=Drancourtella sp. An57 TaxID=1965647 RepID=UPI00195069A3|nr:phage terminase small subunit P27 family [Drancourtella sp. An57]